ncbi:patatin-like phospholipase family protein [Enterovirga sp.]|mgnify:CR=1 FL=1|uniref:patatin-like phospholipase family protein n=1 Tax=Enterovirga sp. TaxID=2026350 RepID=UPI002BEB03F0|nr:patatin-like phospholipase family protein [Enterovirga sp.]HMO30568.1 patatin-like phospholipase family protein [Enterovirga sp.]
MITNIFRKRGGKPAAPKAPIGRISLALQGGGAFGAFTWGVLDRLLEEPDLEFDAASGASAGALNSVLLADGLRLGGPEAAREKLDVFWTKFGQSVSPSLMPSQGAARAIDLSTRLLSPYQLNPLNLNPLRELLSETVDFEALQKDPSLKLLVSTTKVSDGTLRIFREDEISLDAVLASACLPLIHQAVEIEGESYWDGGFAANPPLLPLVEASDVDRVLLIQLIPTSGDDHPTTSPSIVNRLNQITFNNALQRDLETIAALQRLSEEERGRTDAARKLKALTIDHVSAEDWYPDLNHQSALNLKRSFLTGLRDAGREAAGAWLGEEAAAEEPAKAAS